MSWVNNETGLGLAVRKQNYKLESRTGKWKVEKHYPKSVVNIYRAPYVKFKRCLVRLLERQWSIMKLGWGSYQKAELESGKLESTTLKAWCLYIE